MKGGHPRSLICGNIGHYMRGCNRVYKFIKSQERDTIPDNNNVEKPAKKMLNTRYQYRSLRVYHKQQQTTAILTRKPPKDKRQRY